MKKWMRIVGILLICLIVGGTVFARDTLPVQAYTDEEKAAVKAWLSANGYPPTMAGAEQAYQDYLNGKFGPVGGNDGQPESSTPQETTVETETQNEVDTNQVPKPIIEEKIQDSTVKEETSTEMMETDTESVTESETESETESVPESTEETDTDMPSESQTQEEEQEANEGGHKNAVILLLALLVCAAMIYLTVYYCRIQKKS